MQHTMMTLVTIIAEPVLEARITDELRHCGATGFTVVDGRGEGSRQLHAAEIPGVNVRIETIVTATVAERIVAHVTERYFADYAVIVYTTEVAVVRAAKYRQSDR